MGTNTNNATVVLEKAGATVVFPKTGLHIPEDWDPSADVHPAIMFCASDDGEYIYVIFGLTDGISSDSISISDGCMDSDGLMRFITESLPYPTRTAPEMVDFMSAVKYMDRPGFEVEFMAELKTGYSHWIAQVVADAFTLKGSLSSRGEGVNIKFFGNFHLFCTKNGYEGNFSVQTDDLSMEEMDRFFGKYMEVS